MKLSSSLIGKFLYALLFLIFVPSVIILWASYTKEIVKLPPIQSTIVGWILTISGLILMVSGMAFIKIYGKGLPMNAYPPPILVKNGPYRLFRHPIYCGFGSLMVGYFLLIGSASGLWLVSPIIILAMIALVWGYETIYLKKKFPSDAVQTILEIPKNSTDPSSLWDRFITMLYIIPTLLLCNYLILVLVKHQLDPFEKLLLFDFEQNSIVVMSFVFTITLPFSFGNKDILRQFLLTCCISLFLALLITLLYPPLGIWNPSSNELTLINVPLFLLLIWVWSAYKQSVLQAFILSLVVAIIIYLTWLNNSVTPLNLFGSVLIFVVSIGLFPIWKVLRHGAEKIANSWKEWTFGNIRIINHGFYVGFAAFFSILLSSALAGKGYEWPILVFAITVTVFSAIWAQVIEGSEKLKRPFGYYGAMVGIIFASLAVWAMGFSVWIIIGVVSVVMPWAQGIGRLRCLINGCCHGSKVNDAFIGIRYFHHRSRVCGISGLKGELLHPTPLYAIVWLLLVGFVLLSLWKNGYSSSFVFGLYLILTGLGRFVEEAYRGEVQTSIIKGLRLYQWTAIASIIIGIGMTVIPLKPVTISPEFTWGTVVAAVIGGLFTTFAMGVDFPKSNARFSRLV